MIDFGIGEIAAIAAVVVVVFGVSIVRLYNRFVARRNAVDSELHGVEARVRELALRGCLASARS